MHSLYTGKYARIESMEDQARSLMGLYDEMTPEQRKQARKEEF